jgi:outer membrane protein OmpA-like peptidoglycan-associated protein
MTDPTRSGFPHDSDDGTAASHLVRGRQPLRVAPATGQEFNAVELDLVPQACLALRDTVFAFDSSFVQPEQGNVRVSALLARLQPLRQRHLDAEGRLPLLAVFGHADPAGKDEYNKTLSGRRAKAVYGLLTHRVDLWQQLHDTPFGGDDWKHNGAVETMRRSLGLNAATPRAQLFQRYMASLFPTPLAKTEFLGRGTDAGGKADFQGCGELNPVVVFSQEQDREFARPEQRAARNEANQPNRRVLIYLFPPTVVPDASLWPCPRASEPSAGCRPRLFANADERRSPGAAQREFASGGDTFGCRFYDRIAQGSPCEQRLSGRLLVRVVPEVFTRTGNVAARLERIDGQPLPDVTTISLGGKEIDDVFAAPDGRIYFLPPIDGQDQPVQGTLETGQTLVLQTPPRYELATRPAVVALRQQMAVLRQLAEQVVAFARGVGNTEEEARSALCMVIGDGHLRFSASVGQILAAGGSGPQTRLALTAAPRPTGSAQTDVDQALDGFHAEHGTALDAIHATLPRQRVEG